VIKDVSYDPNKKIIVLPVYLAEDVKEQRCYPIYRWIDEERKLVEQNCYDYTEKRPYFV
jgi:hypothetical protein